MNDGSRTHPGIAGRGASAVAGSLRTLDDLRRVKEPRTLRSVSRLADIRKLAEAGIPVGVMAAPVIPGLNDHGRFPKLSTASFRKDGGVQAGLFD